jgi:hypothetical protein
VREIVEKVPGRTVEAVRATAIPLGLRRREKKVSKAVFARWTEAGDDGSFQGRTRRRSQRGSPVATNRRCGRVRVGSASRGSETVGSLCAAVEGDGIRCRRERCRIREGAARWQRASQAHMHFKKCAP